MGSTEQTSERSVYINLPAASVVGICFAAALIALGYFGSVAVAAWANSREINAAANLKIAEINLDAAKHNCLKWPVGGLSGSITHGGTD
jgi:hypothetical protein